MKRILTLLFLLLCSLADIFAVTRYVRQGATGSGSGTDWTNAYTQITAAESAAVRGDLIYVADGTYNSLDFNTPASGTTPITVRKATAADHGTETGWNSTYGDGQATMGAIVKFSTNYWVFDGGSTNNSTCGFVVSHQSGATYGIQITATNITIKNVLIDGTSSATEAQGISFFGGGGTSTIQYCRIQLYDGDGIATSDTSNLTIEYNYIGPRKDGPAHADALQLFGGGNNTFRYNTINWNGQQLFWGGGFTHGAWFIYGNIFSGGPVAGKGIHAQSSNPTVGPVVVYNNTFVNLGSTSINFGGGITTATVINNIFWDTVNPDLGTSHSYNFFETGLSTGGEATAQQTSTSPFVNVSAENYNLAGPTNAGQTLSSPYNTDMNGVVRGADGNWDRGALEYGSGTDTTAPTLINSIIQSNGTTLIRNFSESVATGTADDAGWSITLDGGAVTGTYASGTGTSAITYTLSRTVNGGESGTTTYTQPGNGVEDTAPAANDLATVTQNITNNSTQGQVAIPTISLASGPYYGAQTITLTPNTSGSSIYYTLDGSTPDSGDTLYSTPFTQSSSATIRAIGIKSGSVDSPIATASWEINSWTSSPDWTTFAVPQKTGTFPWAFRVAPSTTTSGTVIGLSSTSVDAYSDMGVIVRFTQTGTIDARNGANYENSATLTYSTSLYYDVVCAVNLTNHTYTITVTPQGGSATQLLTTGGSPTFAFRTEQAAATEFDNVGMIADGIGTVTVSAMNFSSDIVAPTPNPMTFSSNPAAVDAVSVIMTATEATDETSSTVEYFFDETSGNAGGTDSGWQSSRTYVDSGLSANTLYSYRVKARDDVSNETTYSSVLNVTTPSTSGGTINIETLNVTNLRVGP